MARHFSYYDPWREAELTCEGCGWVGRIDTHATELYAELFDFSCPSCERILAIVSYPTLEETEANLDKLSTEERAEFEERRIRHDEYWRSTLRSVDQLPEIDADTITLEWDFERDEHDECYTVIRHGDVVVWRELAAWEAYERFGEIAALLRERYGGRLRDLVPTERSELYLWGDRLSAPQWVDGVRRRLRGGAR